MRVDRALILTLPLILAACAPDTPATQRLGPWGPKADLIAADGTVTGEVQSRRGTNGVMLVIAAIGLPPGPHGMHIHDVGRCDAPGFASAGAHWNPTERQHGHRNPAGWHLGDVDSAEVQPDGKIEQSFSVYRVRLDPADPGTGPVMLDADGAALIVHAQPDDERTDPSGNSGDRIACAVIPPGG